MEWVPKHLDWIKTVRSKILNAQHIRVEDYANNITSGLVAFDELAILVVCRMYHIHVGVVLHDSVWYTSSTENQMKSPFICYFMAVCTAWIPALETGGMLLPVTLLQWILLNLLKYNQCLSLWFTKRTKNLPKIHFL